MDESLSVVKDTRDDENRGQALVPSRRV